MAVSSLPKIYSRFSKRRLEVLPRYLQLNDASRGRFKTCPYLLNGTQTGQNRNATRTKRKLVIQQVLAISLTQTHTVHQECVNLLVNSLMENLNPLKINTPP
jgi:hypothetical protein